MILMSHPTGNANVRQAALALKESSQLAEFWTCLAPDPTSTWMRLLPRPFAIQFQRRALPVELRNSAHTAPLREISRLLAAKLKLSALVTPETGILSVDAVYRSLDRRVSRRMTSLSKPRLTAAYAYEDGARDTFRVCREQGQRCFYDLPIGYWRVWRKLLAEEQEREPEWAATLQGALDTDEKLARKDEEIQLADHIFVASSFTRSTIDVLQIAPSNVHIIPYGAPPVADDISETRADRPLRVLFAGALTQRKGISYLLRAITSLKGHVELTLLGTKPPRSCPALDAALRVHRWIPSLPHNEVLGEMQRHDVLVFPSLFEGFGLVIVEAMSQGLPVITTSHTAGPDIIENGSNGFLIPIRSSEMLALRLEELASDRRLLKEMKVNARATAMNLSWNTYRARLAGVVREAMAPCSHARLANAKSI
jgi:starch synthase